VIAGRQLRALAKEYRRLASLYPGQVSRVDLLRYFLPWTNSLAPGRSPLADRNIWIVFKAKAFLEAAIKPGLKVFEYGMGGSTLYYLQKQCVVCSAEHHAEWYKNVATEVDRLKSQNWRGYLHVPDGVSDLAPTSGPGSCSYRSEFGEYAGRTFRNYVKAIDEFPPDFFDLVSIDGRARDSCFVRARDKVRPGGLLLLDNSERPRYQPVHYALARAEWTRHHFFGPGPYVRHEFWGTTIWRRPG
jgi:hypothetical protein